MLFAVPFYERLECPGCGAEYHQGGRLPVHTRACPIFVSEAFPFHRCECVDGHVFRWPARRWYRGAGSDLVIPAPSCVRYAGHLHPARHRLAERRSRGASRHPEGGR